MNLAAEQKNGREREDIMIPELVAEQEIAGSVEKAILAPLPVSDASPYIDADAYDRYLAWKREPLQTSPKLSIVIPAYNEAVRIVPTIGAMASYVCSLELPWELIIADDGSKDETVALCDGLELANLRVLIAEKNGGKGSAVRRGVLAARGERILFADADNSTPIEELSKLMARMDEGNDVVIGSRAASGADEAHRSFIRRTMSNTLRAMIQPILGMNIKDTQCGFKLFGREAAQRIFGAQTIMGFSFDLEILYLAHKFGYKVVEEPVSWIDAPGSKVDKMKEIRRFLKDMATIKINDMKGIYG
jgi:dolichyl-phosphate beta-glucosyltransferase